jgi:hypothetical protein
MEEHRLKVSENRLLGREYMDLKGRKWETGEDCTVRSFIICVLHQILLG